jgi:hypothetical protein
MKRQYRTPERPACFQLPIGCFAPPIATLLFAGGPRAFSQRRSILNPARGTRLGPLRRRGWRDSLCDRRRRLQSPQRRPKRIEARRVPKPVRLYDATERRWNSGKLLVGDQRALLLGERGEKVQDERVDVRAHLRHDKRRLVRHKSADEGDIPRKPVQLRNNDRRALAAVAAGA